MESLFQFITILQEFKKIERAIYVNGTERKESDPEHSYSLAMLAWYINDTQKLGFDTEKLLSYALIHDLVEVYAGDVPFYNQSDPEQKHKDEEAAAQRLQQEFPEFPKLHTLIAKYEKQEDPESTFIYALDKIEPALNIYLDEGKSWQRDGITLEMIKELKRPKVAGEKIVSKMLEDLILKLEEHHDHLFLGKDSADGKTIS